MNGDEIPGVFVYGAIEPAKGFIVIIERDEDACDLLAGDVTPVCFIDQLLQHALCFVDPTEPGISRSEEHTSELQSQSNLVCRLLLEKKKKNEKKSSTSNKNNYLNNA